MVPRFSKDYLEKQVLHPQSHARFATLGLLERIADQIDHAPIKRSAEGTTRHQIRRGEVCCPSALSRWCKC